MTAKSTTTTIPADQTAANGVTPDRIAGIHHITAFAAIAKENLAFYTKVLGLRLVKQTVNFDDPGTYHFYFGDYYGRPGSILTFFPIEHASPGRRGTGEVAATTFAVPRGAWLLAGTSGGSRGAGPGYGDPVRIAGVDLQ